VKQAVNVPVTANGDVDSPEMAREVLEHTGADAVMIGRAAQGRPWIFREIRHFLDYGEKLPSPCVAEIRQLILEHLAEHHAFHGEESGVRIARKHLGWYTADLEGGNAFRHEMNAIDDASAQIAAVNRFFDELSTRGDRLTYMSNEAPIERARRMLPRNFEAQEAQAA
jgi:tRNA-dihydrouridine synthase B